MKKSFLSLFALIGFVVAATGQTTVDLPIRFDSVNVNYALVDFGGNVSSIVSDPAGGTNQVLKVDKTAGAQTWAGTTIGGTGLATAIPFAPGSTVITMRVYSPDSGIVVRLKAEDPNDPTRSVETNAQTSGINTWETLTFDFVNQASGTAAINYTYVYGKLSAFFNFGVDGATAGAKTYYCDDIEFIPGAPLPVNITFQVSDPDSTPVFVFGSWSGWSNWPGTPMTSAGPGLYSVTIQLNPSASYEYLFVNGGTPVAETLNPSWPCTNGNVQYTNRTLTTGTSDATYCSVWDSCTSCNAVVLAQVDLPVTFDDTTVNYALNDFGGNTSSIVADPAGGNNKACRIEKSNTAQTWAGTTIGNPLGFASGIPFAANATQMTMRVYSPDSGTVIRMKAEDPSNTTISVETEAVTTTSNAWETLTYDFANQATGTAPINFANNYGKLSVFFNFGVDGATAGTKVYHFDDVTLLPPGPSQVNVTFQVQNPDSAPVFIFGSWSGWSNFPGTLMAPVGNGVYSVDIPLTANTGYEFKFVNGGTVPTLETLDPSWPCTNGNAQYTNRVLALGANDTTICAVWDSCSSCTPIVMSPVDLPVTFDDNMVNYDLIDFGGNASMIEPDPAGGTNLVCKTIKPNTALSWAGTTIGGTVGFANPVPFAAGATTMSMRIYSPDAGIPVRMKVEDPTNGAISVETEAVTTTSNTWETMVFDFSSPVSGTAPINFANNYQKLSVFFNFGTDGATAGSKTYYFDDVQFGGTLPTITITFQVESPDSLPVYVFGSWSNWSNFPGTQLTPAAASNTYETSITLNANSTYEYLFVNGGTPVTEDLDPAGACTNGNAQYTNRTLLTGSANATICSVWGNCTACGTVGIGELLNDRYSVTVFPEGIRINADAPSSIREIVVYDFLGKVLYSNEKEVTVNTLLPFNHGSAAMLVVKFVTDEGIAVYKVPAIK